MNNLIDINIKTLDQLRKGNSEAFSKIYRTYHKDLIKYLCFYTNNLQLAEDLAQEVFFYLWDKRNTIVILTSLKSYLYRVGYNRYIDHVRKKKEIVHDLEKIRFELVHEILDEEKENYELRISNLKKAIENLPDKCKQIFLLNKYEGYRQYEIAEHLNLSIKTVENHIGRAYRALRKSLLIVIVGLIFVS